MSDVPVISIARGYPVPSTDHAALLASYELALGLGRELLPVEIRGDAGRLFFEDWETTRAALIARIAGTLRHLGYLAPSYSQLDGVALTRTLLEHTITFAWISADPPNRLVRFLRDQMSRTLTKDKEFRKRGDTLLDESLRKRYRAFVRTETGDMLGIRNQAVQADERWLEEGRELHHPMELPALTELYDHVYDHYAHLDHPSIAALQQFVHTDTGTTRITIDGEPERDRESDARPYWIGLWCFVWALTVSTVATGRPRRKALKETVGHIRALREFDRHGLLDVRHEGDTMRIGLVDNADARIAEIAAALNASTQ